MPHILGRHEQTVLSWPKRLMPNGQRVYCAVAQMTFIDYISNRPLATFVSFSSHRIEQGSWTTCTSNLHAILIVPSGPCTSAEQSPPFLTSVYE